MDGDFRYVSILTLNSNWVYNIFFFLLPPFVCVYWFLLAFIFLFFSLVSLYSIDAHSLAHRAKCVPFPVIYSAVYYLAFSPCSHVIHFFVDFYDICDGYRLGMKCVLLETITSSTITTKISIKKQTKHRTLF